MKWKYWLFSLPHSGIEGRGWSDGNMALGIQIIRGIKYKQVVKRGLNVLGITNRLLASSSRWKLMVR